MKKVLSLLLAMTMTFGVFSGLGVSAAETENVTEEVTKTYGLDNLNNEAGELKIAFIGGSITQGAGEVSNKAAERYSGKLVNDYFKAKFPNKTVTEINAGIGGTPSEYGIFRLGKDVSAFAPDVVFVEFAVNDLNHAASTAGQLKVRSQMESIVRQLEALPKIPVIIFLYSHCENKQDYLENAIKEHQKIAKYYGIGSVNFHEYVLSEETAGNIDWYNEENSGSLSGDGTHPNTAGYAMYAKYIADRFEENYTSYFKNPKIRNAQYEQSYIYANPHTVAYDDEAIEYTGTWTESPDLDYLQDGTHDWVIYPENLNSTFIQAQEGGETVSYTFTGRSIGIAYGRVFNGGKATYVVDEGTDNEITGEINCDTDAIRYYQIYTLIANDLAYGEHTIKLTNVAVDDVKTNFAFSHFLVDDQEPVIGVDDVPEYAFDYVPGEMPESIMKWAAPGETEANRSGERGWMSASRNSTALDTDREFDGSVNQSGWGTAGSYSPRAIKTLVDLTEGTAVGADGMASIVYTAYDPSRTVNYFKMDNSKNYVFSIDIKDNLPSNSPAALVNFAVSNDSVATRAWSKEYGAEGFSVTGEYKTYAGTFDLPDTFKNDGKQVISAGFIVGNGAGESIGFKTSNLGDIYFAEEVAYDIKNEMTSGESGLFSGETATFKASVLNQIGSEGYLAQNFTWKVLNKERTEEVEGFTVLTDETTQNATVTVGDTVETGTYTIVAVSDDYEGFVKGVTVQVYGDDYYKDYVKGEMPASLMKWAAGGETSANRSGERGWMEASRNCRVLDTDRNFDGNVIKTNWGTAGSYSPRSIYTVEAITEGTAVGADGMASIVYTAYDPSRTVNYFKMDNSKNYVFRVDIKDNYPEQSPAALVNFAVSNDSVATRAWSKEYGAEGFSVTGDYKTYAGTFNLPDTFKNDGKQVISAGFIAGNGAGESIAFRTSNLGDIYFAEEVPYDIVNTKVEGPDKLQTGHSATYKAEVLNQIGSTGYLAQNFTWYVMNPERTEFIDGFTVTEDEATGTVTVVPGETVSTGRYSLVAISDDYNMAKGADIRVIADDYYEDHEVPAMPENIFETFYGKSAAAQVKKFQRNNASVQTYDNVEPANDGLPTMKYKAETDISYDQYSGLFGWIVNKSERNTFAKGETYLFKIRAKDASTEGNNAIINAVIHNETNAKLTHSWPLETKKASSGLKLTDEYADYIFTIPVGEAFDESAANHYFTFGFIPGTFKDTAFEVDTTNNDSFYFAKEIVYDIKNTVKTGSEELKAGETVTLEAKVVNQLGGEGTLAQNFTWVALDTDRKNVIEGITVTPSADTKTVTVTVADSVELGKYTIVAVSEDYDIARGVNIEVVSASEKISSLEILEQGGYVMFNASVADTTAENVFFVLAAYTSEGLVAVKSQPVSVENGTASVTDMMFDEALASGTVVKAFVWNYDDLSPIQNPDNFVTTLTVQ